MKANFNLANASDLFLCKLVFALPARKPLFQPSFSCEPIALPSCDHNDREPRYDEPPNEKMDGPQALLFRAFPFDALSLRTLA